MRPAPDPLAFFEAIEKAPFSFDFYQALRHIEALFPDQPRLGQGVRAADEPVRLGQEPSMSFAPAALSHADRNGANGKLRIDVRFFGLFGPNGPLPFHLTEYARDRELHAGDSTFADFLDIFHHRFLSLFYRAWAQGQPTVSLDRPSEDRFATYVGSLIGHGSPGFDDRDALPDFPKLAHAGLLSRQVRNAESLAALLQDFFKLPVRIEEFVGHWMVLETRDRTRLGAAGSVLGGGATLGGRVWDRQHKFRLHFGPLSLREFESLLPGELALGRIAAWVRNYVGFEFAWDTKVILKRDEVPATALGTYGRLGWTTWLGHRPAASDADDLVLDAEVVLSRPMPKASHHGDPMRLAA